MNTRRAFLKGLIGLATAVRLAAEPLQCVRMMAGPDWWMEPQSRLTMQMVQRLYEHLISEQTP